jgi:hypothetical protein
MLVLSSLIATLSITGQASGRIIVIIGPTTPHAKSTPGMAMRFKPRVADASAVFKGVAHGFKPGEYVTAWEFSRGGHSTQLNGKFSNRRGRVTIHRQTAAGISSGRRKICLQGERTKRVACARYRVRATGLETGPGYVPPADAPDYVAPTTGPGYVAPGSA